jgi:hypothetical protein
MKLLRVLLLWLHPACTAALESLRSFQAVDSVSVNPGTNAPILFGGGAASASSFVYILVELLHAFDSFTETDIRFVNLGNEVRVLCRLLNFTTNCQNPWTGTGDDAAHPFAVDFAIFERSQDFQSPAEPDLRLFPLAATPIAVLHNVQSLTAPLVLSRILLARIFRGNVTAWNDSGILALNPGQDQALSDAGSISIVSQSQTQAVTGSFKLALSSFDPDFNITGDPDEPSFPNVNVTMVQGFYAVPSRVSSDYPRTAGAADISFMPVTQDTFAHSRGPLMVWVTPTNNRSDAVAPSLDSARIALFESALSSTDSFFINFAASARAWPFMQGTYVGVRMETLRPGATCANSVALMHLLLSLFNDDNHFTPILQAIADSTSALLMPVVLRAKIYDVIKAQMKCEYSQLVAELAFPSPARNLYVGIPDGLEDLFTILIGNYEAISGNTNAFRKKHARQAKPTYKMSYATANASSLYDFNVIAQQVQADGAFLVLPSSVVPMIKGTVTPIPFMVRVHLPICTDKPTRP